MKSIWKNSLGGALVAFAFLGAGSAMALENDFGAWDEDGDGVLSSEEFGAGLDDSGMFSTWDENSDGVLDNDEYNSGIYDSYDADDSGDLSEDEFGDYADDAGDGGFWDV